MAALGATAGVALAYYLVARLGLALLSPPSDVAVFWPASGLAAGIFILSKRRFRPAIVVGVIIGTVAANLMSDRHIWTSLLKGICNACEAALVSGFIEYWFGRSFGFDDLQRVLGFAAAACLGAAASAFAGAATMTLFHSAAPYWDVWHVWFLSDGVGIVMVAPLVIGLGQAWHRPPSRAECIEAAGVLSLLALIIWQAVAHPTSSWLSFAPDAVALPLLLWLVARCEPTFGIAGALIVSLSVVCATTFGIGHFGDAAVPTAARVGGAHLVIVMVSLYTLTLAALFAQRKDAEERLAKKSIALTRLHEASSQLWRKRDLRMVLDEILAGAIELLDADMGHIQILDTRRRVQEIVAHRGTPQEYLDTICKLSIEDGSACVRALQSGMRVVIEDVEVDTRYKPLRPVARSVGYRAEQSTPILSSEASPLGILSTQFRSPRQLKDEDLHLLDLYVRLAADIIERHQADDALRKSEERLRLAQLKTGIGLWDWELRSGKVAWTPELEAIFGLEPGTVKTYADFRSRVHPDDIERVENERDAAIRRREQFKVEFRIIRADGVVRRILAMGGAFYDEVTGEPTRVLGNNLDITERKLAELGLTERNTQLGLASKTARVGSFAVDIPTGTVNLSPGSASILGLPEGTLEITRDDARKLIHPDDLDQLDTPRDQAFLSGESEFIAQFRILRADNGEPRWIDWRSIILYDEADRPVRLIAVIIDFTERKRTEVLLSQSKGRLADAMATGRVMAFEWDAVTGASERSDNAADILGFDSDGLTGSQGDDLLSHILPEDRQRFMTCIRLLRPDKPTYAVTFRFVRPDGAQLWLEETAKGEFDATGRLLRVKGLTRDISERKRAELALTERTMQLELAGKAALVGSFGYGVDAEKMQISEGYAAVYGFPEGTTSIARSQWLAKLHPNDVDRVDAARSQALRQRRREYGLEYRFISPSGEIRWIEARTFISYRSDGRPERMVGVNIDVTERKWAEIARQASEAKFAGILAIAGDAIISIDGNHRITLFNEAAERLFGYSRGEMIGQPMDVLIPTRFRVAHQQHIECFTSGPGISRRMAEQREVLGRRKNGEEFPTEASISKIKIAGEWVCTVVLRDTTERKHAEEHQRVLLAELDHRVKNVLATVSTIVARTMDASSSMQHFVASLDGRIQSMARTHELLSAAQWQGMSVRELVRRELAPYATSGNTDINGPAVVLKAEAGQSMGMVLHELATNAAKYGALSTQNGRVSICWHQRLNGHASPNLVLEWQEVGGPSVVAPENPGFGTSTIRDLIPYEFGGTVDLAFDHSGVRCRLELPADWLTKSDEPISQTIAHASP
jgi:PAS domain S-box-containing protein